VERRQMMSLQEAHMTNLVYLPLYGHGIDFPARGRADDP
jgi:hypothetical protein